MKLLFSIWFLHFGFEHIFLEFLFWISIIMLKFGIKITKYIFLKHLQIAFHNYEPPCPHVIQTLPILCAHGCVYCWHIIAKHLRGSHTNTSLHAPITTKQHVFQTLTDSLWTRGTFVFLVFFEYFSYLHSASFIKNFFTLL